MFPDLLAPDRATPYLLGALLIGYLIGATPVGLLIARWVGIGDIRRIGSGNIGATNVLRSGNRGAALATLLLDAAKGFIPTALAFLWYGPLVASFAGLGAFVGHCFSVYLGFWGGKGVATGLGVLLALRWEIGLLCAAAWLIVVLITRRASAGSLTAAALAVVLFPLYEAWDMFPVVVLMAFVVVYRHRGNIGRLLRGAEPAISLGGRRSDP